MGYGFDTAQAQQNWNSATQAIDQQLAALGNSIDQPGDNQPVELDKTIEVFNQQQKALEQIQQNLERATARSKEHWCCGTGLKAKLLTGITWTLVGLNIIAELVLVALGGLPETTSPPTAPGNNSTGTQSPTSAQPKISKIQAAEIAVGVILVVTMIGATVISGYTVSASKKAKKAKRLFNAKEIADLKAMLKITKNMHRLQEEKNGQTSSTRKKGTPSKSRRRRRRRRGTQQQQNPLQACMSGYTTLSKDKQDRLGSKEALMRCVVSQYLTKDHPAKAAFKQVQNLSKTNRLRRRPRRNSIGERGGAPSRTKEGEKTPHYLKFEKKEDLEESSEDKLENNYQTLNKLFGTTFNRRALQEVALNKKRKKENPDETIVEIEGSQEDQPSIWQSLKNRVTSWMPGSE